MQARIEEFLALNRRRWSPTTLDRYRWYLVDMAGRLAKQPRLERVKERQLVAWLDSHPGWSPNTAYTALVACKSFFAWALGAERSPARSIPLPRRERSPQRVFDHERFQRLLFALDTAQPKGRRDLAIILLMLDTGLRSAEICRLQLRHVDLAAGRLSARVKGGKWRDAVFCEYVVSCLASWIAVRQQLGVPDTCEELFVSIGGKTPARPITTGGLRTIFRHLGERIGYHFSPHDFRRTFATEAIRNGAPTITVGRAGGWASTRELESRYTPTIRAEDIDPYSPVRRWMGEERTRS